MEGSTNENGFSSPFPDVSVFNPSAVEVVVAFADH